MVSGTQNPETEQALCRLLPDIAEQLREALRELEQVFGDIQDVEFTIENGKRWILQTRSAKRTPRAALRLAVDFVKEGRITPRDALQRLTGLDVQALVEKRLVVSEKPVAYGTVASSGVAVGRAAFDPQSAARRAASRRTGHSRASRYDDRRRGQLRDSSGNSNGPRRPNRSCCIGGATNGKAVHRWLHRAIDERSQ